MSMEGDLEHYIMVKALVDVVSSNPPQEIGSLNFSQEVGGLNPPQEDNVVSDWHQQHWKAKIEEYINLFQQDLMAPEPPGSRQHLSLSDSELKPLTRTEARSVCRSWSDAPLVSRGRRRVRKSKYRGVRFRSGKWCAEIRNPITHSRVWLGTYNSEEAAAEAYDTAKFGIKGIRGQFNFPDRLFPAESGAEEMPRQESGCGPIAPTSSELPIAATSSSDNFDQFLQLSVLNGGAGGVVEGSWEEALAEGPELFPLELESMWSPMSMLVDSDYWS